MNQRIPCDKHLGGSIHMIASRFAQLIEGEILVMLFQLRLYTFLASSSFYSTNVVCI
jgi:hypothetical protein